MPIATVNPATGETVRTFAPHTPDEVEARIGQAADAQRTLAAASFSARGTWMRAAADLVEADVDQTAPMLALEMGKPLAQARGEVLKCAKGMRFYADNAERFLADDELADPAAVGASHARTSYVPLGVVLAVMPWNFPLWQVLRFAAPALMAGNAALLKHASNVPQAALYLDTLFERAGFPSGSFRTLLIGSADVADVIADPRVHAVTLTGSEPAGRSVAALAGQHIKKTVLELGGSDPFIVMPSADLDAAVETAVTARVTNNGQSCVCGKRFIVHADIYDEFSQAFAARMGALVVGDPLESETQVGPLATRSGRDELAELVDDAMARGATLLAQATTPEGAGFYFPPTVLADIPEDARLVHEEAFGPVATLYRARDREDAARLANQTSFGLSSAVWTADPEEAEWFIAALEAGAVFVNGMSASYPELPFGGIKASGYGRELAANGIREFCSLKTVWKA
jgi:succinate-semialdehyde dehydrogenase/glutarate-semialdehyde dehydrogenase